MKKRDRMYELKTLMTEKIKAIGGDPQFVCFEMFGLDSGTGVAEDLNHKGRVYIGECYVINDTPKCNLRIFTEV